MDIQTTMNNIGQAARKASRIMAKQILPLKIERSR